MQLVWLDMAGYGRFAKTRMNLSANLTAVVGANEAGKSTVLAALAELSNEREIDARRVHTGMSRNQTSVEGLFLLSEDERTALGSAVPEASEARWYRLQKSSDGSLSRDLVPEVLWSRDMREKALSATTRLSGMRLMQSSEHVDMAEQVAQAVGLLGRSKLGAEELDELSEFEASLREFGSGLKDPPAQLGKTAEAVAAFCEYRAGQHPGRRAVAIAREWEPSVVSFTSEARDLRSDYGLPPADQPSALMAEQALANLAALAGLDLVALHKAYHANLSEFVDDHLDRANTELADAFEEAWGQSDLKVRLAINRNSLCIHARSDDGALHRIAERSDGLRSFVALTAFLRQQAADNVILLIDEAEQHLHWDAQADLVNVLERQGLAAQVVYTTHSPACLPSDLGGSIRLVIREDLDNSRVSNAPWAEGSGLAPILMAAGASTAAITPARYAVVAEGATEFILLPTLLGDASERLDLGFQVVPGLSEASDENLRELDLVAARVAYLVDGDGGGKKKARQLRSAGIDESRIVSLPNGLTFEDLISADLLRGAIEEELRRSGEEGVSLDWDSMPADGRPAWLDKQFELADRKPPSKAYVASRIAEQLQPEAPAETTPDDRGSPRPSLVESGRMAAVKETLAAIDGVLFPSRNT